MALIGALSLSGMMLKNSIIFVDEIRANEAAGRAPPLRLGHPGRRPRGASPIMLSAGTTILGVAPLLLVHRTKKERKRLQRRPDPFSIAPRL